MRKILHRLLPCISTRQAVLENFNEKEQEILELFPTKLIIPTSRIKIVKAILTQNGGQLFIATMRIKQQTRQVALQQIELTGPEDENITRVIKLFQRRRRMTAKRARNFIDPVGITVMRYQRCDALCLVLDWPSDMQNQTFVSYLQKNQTSVSTQIQLLRDTLTGIQDLRDAKIINPDAYNITARHLFIDGGLNVKIAFYGLKTNDAGDAILGPNETFETRLVWNIGMILTVISGSRNGPLRAFKAACLEENPAERPKFHDLIREFDAIFSKNGEKYQSEMPISSPYFQRSPEVARYEKMAKYEKGKLENTKTRCINPNVTFYVSENFTDYDTDSTGVQL